MSNTPNYGLYLTDDDTISFLEWRKKMNGAEDSNMTKIDAALKELAETPGTPGKDGKDGTPGIVISSEEPTDPNHPVWINLDEGGATDNPLNIVNATVSLPASGWSVELKTQTVNVTGVTETANCIVTAAPASFVAYGEAWVRCTAQGAGTLTFACESVPTEDLTANVLILG